MTTIAHGLPASSGRDGGFFMGGAIAMTLVIVAGFSVQLAMGRSSFSAPWYVHAHAVAFMGWVGIFLAQNVLVATDRIALHRRLGWIAAFWIVAMIVLGCVVTVAMLRRGGVPFFFRPLHFLVFDPVALLTFAGLTWTAVRMRKQTDWHRRLHFSGMAILMGPGFGRLVPAPLLMPWAWEVTMALCLVFPIAGMIADLRRDGRIHPAWFWGMGVLIGSTVLVEAITYSPIGTTLYAAVTAGSPGAEIAPLAFPPPPGPPPT